MSGCGHYLDTSVPKSILFLALAAAAFSQTRQTTIDPAYAELDKAYQALKAKDYDHAIAGFERAIALAPDRPSVRKDLGYTLLKVGETAAARDQFAEAMRLDPGDDQVALEYAFLCYETRQEITARRIFDRYRKSSATAAQAFENIDRPLREGIERWTQALAVSPDNFSGHQELARLAEQRDELPLAAEQYERAWRLRPDRLRALLSYIRPEEEATRTAAWMGRMLAISMGLYGLLAGQFMLVFFALFIYLGAAQESVAALGRSLTHGIPIRAAMITEFHTLEHRSTIRDAANLLLSTSQQDFPVIHGTQVVGLLGRKLLIRAIAAEGPDAYVAGAMDRDFLALEPNADLAEVLPLMAQAGRCALVMEGGHLTGLLTTDNLSEFLLLRRFGMEPVL